MIGQLRGKIVETGENWAMIDVQGVGYIVQASRRSLDHWAGGAGISEFATILTDMQVREDAMTLFGFASKQEQFWFRLLTTVQGVGGRVALAMLGIMTPDQLGHALASGDKAMLTRADGVGPKLAARLITELKDKIPLGDIAAPIGKGVKDAAPVASGPTQDAISALVNLGYQRFDAFRVVTAANQELGESASLDQLIKEGLKRLTTG